MGFFILGNATFRQESKNKIVFGNSAYMQFLQVSHREKEEWDRRDRGKKVSAISMCVYGGGGEVEAS